MSNRYQRALAFGGEEGYRAALKEDTELLAQFGLRLMTIMEGGGVRVAFEEEIKGGPERERVNPWSVVGLESKAWNWLRPLLLELRDSRRNGNASKVVDLMERLAAK